MKLITSLSEVMKMREINEVLIPLKISGISVIYPTGLDKVYLRILQCKKLLGACIVGCITKIFGLIITRYKK
jgi:hypothetical protein